MHRIQQLAAGLLEKVEGGRTLTEALADAQRQAPDLTPAERGALQDIGYGVLRHLAEWRCVLRRLLPKPLPEPQLERVLLVALHQLEYTRAAQYAVVNEAVTLAGRLARGRFKGLVNAVLRNYLRRRDELQAAVAADDEARYNHPRWWIKALQRHYPQDWQAILEMDNRHPPMTLRVNRRHGEAAAYLQRLREAGIEAEALGDEAIRLARPVGVRELPGFADGDVSVQDQGAQQAAHRLDLRDGLRVLDACAAPGGKTCHMLELADLDVTALDVDETRLGRVADNLARLKLSARLVAADASDTATWWDGVPFDRILADVPCSASGVVRRHPDIKWLRRPGDFAELARQQSALVDALWPLLASGGKMLYATCSIFPEENREQLAAFLARHADAVCLDDQQLLPSEQHDGFYYALLAKR
ncbi:16S rRNA (cytosine(967)-C(5))-methyltransferase RsmB [Pseudogulbenkiania sp. MAI-1]|uniref:16S rRNA (cytosine(967)-C(5))-methyltransferase RsmB n=1 Tax=Pseudogulbenkiania sp. MAI-1 TaxID=990370 RepID=UPI00045EBCCD|nr:16S rRNA (cytosine(967)-C(5))-methyltransferase RsmB [Pseudogulbenkiania sp. MAI-1]